MTRTCQASHRTIETFANPAPEHDYTIRMSIPEFTCLCPRTGQPDFATLELEYVPDRLCIELKSLKLYIWSFRDRGSLSRGGDQRDHRASWRRPSSPRFMRLTARFNVRGGIYTTVIAERRAPGWRAPETVHLS